MYGMRRFGIILGLETIGTILEGLGNPQDTFSAIHIAGTNGKGSIASTLSTILQQAGYRVGLYTSPHLIRFNERIRINGTPILDEDVVASWEAVKSVHPGDREPTFFEYATAMAFHEFGRQGVDYAVIETGMGGRMDATNVVSPVVTVITNISLEHKNYLGDTIAQIAGEKAGIIKPSIPVVSGVNQKNAKAVIEQTAAERSAPVYMRGRDFRVRRRTNGRFSYWGIDHKWTGMHTGLIGHHQVDNAALTLAACELLKQNGIDLSRENIQAGLILNHWPGRIDVVSENPFVVLDGAHNIMAARRLRNYLEETLAGRRITMVAGILDDKPFETILKDLLLPCTRLIVTQAKIDRSLPTETIEAAARPLISKIEIVPDVAEATRHAIATSAPEDAVCVAGSLYVVGEAKAMLEDAGSALFQL
ncbi:MAG: bifunctional tetrahydrofolate synthase/dihydrofolate synthase [Proteobacteria bacterium]|nr:MAG: bifunctional tetrahydrofolate synthase/dihydrofolate synthase [Pseudomonadota bacterium]PIE67484.1 MAG: bifunctional tetrahydrofolate synthase/dihydrofolate synthase [Deltaproteobacteria bacterium]